MEGRLLRTPRMLPLALFYAGLASACGTTPPAPAAPSVVAPTTTETFAGTLTVGGTQFYSFSVAQYGTVNVTLASLDGSDSSPLQLTLAMGRPAARVCTEGSAVTTAPGATAQLTGTFDPGVYCAQLSDIGNLTGSTKFVVTIAHP